MAEAANQNSRKSISKGTNLLIIMINTHAPKVRWVIPTPLPPHLQIWIEFVSRMAFLQVQFFFNVLTCEYTKHWASYSSGTKISGGGRGVIDKGGRLVNQNAKERGGSGRNVFYSQVGSWEPFTVELKVALT